MIHRSVWLKWEVSLRPRSTKDLFTFQKSNSMVLSDPGHGDVGTSGALCRQPGCNGSSASNSPFDRFDENVHDMSYERTICSEFLT